MRKNRLNIALAIFITGGMLACNPLKKMSEEAENVKYTVNPNPLELHGDSVAMSIS